MNISEKIETLLSRYKIKITIRILFTFVFLFPVILISVYFISHLYKTLSTWELDRIQTNIDYTKRHFDSTLSQVKDFSDRIYVNRQIQQVILTQYDDVQDVYAAYADIKFLEDYLLSYPEISSFRIYTTNYTLLDNQFIIKATKSVQKENWYAEAIGCRGKSFLFYNKDKVSKKYYLSMVRSIWASSGKLVGVIIININPDYIEKNILNTVYDTFIIYDYWNLYSSNKQYSSSDESVVIQTANTKAIDENGICKIKLSKGTCGIVSSAYYPQDNQSYKFILAYIVPYKNLSKATRIIVLYSIFLIILIVLLSFILNLIFTNYLNSRVQKIKSGLSSVVENNFELSPSIGGKDEFESIYHDLYDTSGKIKNLIDTVYTQNLEKEKLTSRQNEISFKMLSSQINPHFLFNSLETIRMKSLSSGDKEVSVMLRILASLLRYNLSVKGTPVSLIKEIEAIENYLTIQHMRFGERISYDVVPICNINNFCVLPLLIQPIVENSFNHGLEDRVSGGFIYILISTEIIDSEEFLMIKVSDNGVGIAPEKLEELKTKLENSENQIYTSSIGLVNVNSRIKLMYGKKYGISISSVLGEGTTVCLKLPVISQMQETILKQSGEK